MAAAATTVDEQGGACDVDHAASAFIDTVSRTLPPPLLQPPRRKNEQPQRRKRCPAHPMRKSVCIAARNWPDGDTHTRARQVLMKKLGIMEEEGLTPDDHFLRYIDLFRGPLDGPAVMALTALSGLDTAIPAAAAKD
jgi:hypothetical protein